MKDGILVSPKWLEKFINGIHHSPTKWKMGFSSQQWNMNKLTDGIHQSMNPMQPNSRYNIKDGI